MVAVALNELEAAFDDLFAEVWPRAVATARRIVGPGGDPEAIAAEALTRAYDRWPQVARHPVPAAWVLRTVLNLGLDAARRRARRHGPGGGTDTVLDLRDGHEPTFRTTGVTASEDVTALRLALVAALRHLPDRQRDAVALRYLAGCAEPDIAASLGVAPGTVKTHLKRGLDSLRRELGADDLEGTLAHA